MTNEITARGIVVSSMPVGENDKRIVLLTKELGKVSAFIRGAKKPTSPLLAAGNPFSFGEFTLYPGRNSYTVRSAHITSYFNELLGDLDSVWYGYYFLEIAEYYSKEGLDESTRLNLLYAALRALERSSASASSQEPAGPDKELIRTIYELKTMVINGEYPNVFSCVNCGKTRKEDFSKSDNFVIKGFSVRKGGVLCDECVDFIRRGNRTAARSNYDSTAARSNYDSTAARPNYDSEQNTGSGAYYDDIIPISPSALYMMQLIITLPISRLFSFRVKEPVLMEVKDIIRRWRRHYSDHKYKSEKYLDLK